MKVREMTASDWPEVARIYAEGIETGIATFETAVPAYALWDEGHMKACRLVLEKEENLAAWAALSPVSKRPAYAGVAELSIYVENASRGRGLGAALLNALVADAPAHGIWTLQATLLAGNAASLHLHEKCGFRVVGLRERIARDASDAWRDTILMERRL